MHGSGPLPEEQWDYRAVAVNNWLISTNLYPPAGAYNVASLISESLDRWPRHAIWFRSLNARYTADWLGALVELGCVLIPSRQVYLFDRIDPKARHPPDLRRDFRLLEPLACRFQLPIPGRRETSSARPVSMRFFTQRNTQRSIQHIPQNS